MDFDSLEEGEYIVKGHLKIDVPDFHFYKNDEPIFLEFYLHDFILKTYVTDYQKAPYHLLAVAERIRDYTAYVCQMPIPLSFYMSGKRPDMGFPIFPLPTIYDGRTHLPFSDGGFNDVALFHTGFGSSNGLKPPLDVMESIEKLSDWSEKINTNLKRAQNLLDKIEDNSPLDIALRSVGKSHWMETVEERFTCRWKAIEAVARIDNPNSSRIHSSKLLKTIQKRVKDPLNHRDFNRLRELRNIITHNLPPHENSREIHWATDRLYLIATELIESVLKEEGIF